MTSLDKLFEILDSDPNLKRLHDLEAYFDSNEDIVKLIKQKQNISKSIVQAKMMGLIETYKEYRNEYKKINEQIEDFPLLNEYIDLLEYYNDLLVSILDYLGNKINRSLK